MIRNKKYKQGYYKLKNPSKYRGDANNIIYRSGWEQKILYYLDNHPSVIWFASEELVIPYISPLDNKQHRYFPDFILKIRDKEGKEQVYVWEIKPHSQTQIPTQKRQTQRLIREAATYAVNQEKWKAADIFCKKNGLIFKVITEKNLNLK